MQTRFIALALATALIVGGAYVFAPRSAEPGLLPGAANAQEATGSEVAITEMVLGNEEATVEVIEYASYTCPHCATFHANQFEQIKANYIDTGKIRFVYREVYFDRPGLWASMVARCGGEERFFGISEMIYERQGTWARQQDPNEIVDSLRRMALTAGVTNEELDVCLTDADKAAALVQWYEANAEADGITSTPSFVINGTRYSNMGYEEFAAILDRELGE